MLLPIASHLAKRSYSIHLVCICLLVSLFMAPSSAFATTVWNGPSMSFSKAGFADWTLEANQDRITDSVWITRGSDMGLFNIKSEDLYLRGESPADTEWAWDLAGFNAGLEIAASNYENLEFNVWRTAHGGSGGGPASTVGTPGVLHLISDDIYIDIMFTGFGSQDEGGGSFSYVRSTVPEPSTALLLAIGLVSLSGGRRSSKR